MTTTRSLLRSVLFTPGDRLKAMEKAVFTGTTLSDAVIFDLEDAIAADSDSKYKARQNVINFFLSSIAMKSDQGLSTRRYKRPIIALRINCPVTTNWGREDLAAIAAAISQTKNIQLENNNNLNSTLFDALVLPKVEDTSSLHYTTKVLKSASSSILPPLWAMIETARGIRNVFQISDYNNLQTLVFGSNDLSKDLKLRTSSNHSTSLLYSKSQCIIAARSSGKTVIDGVFMDIRNAEGFRESCILSRDLGFDGKSLIHPDQVASTHEVFAPSEAEVIRAKRVVEAFEEARVQGRGVAVLDGQLIEHLHVLQAQGILSMSTIL